MNNDFVTFSLQLDPIGCFYRGEKGTVLCVGAVKHVLRRLTNPAQITVTLAPKRFPGFSKLRIQHVYNDTTLLVAYKRREDVPVLDGSATELNKLRALWGDIFYFQIKAI